LARIAALADLHINEYTDGQVKKIFQKKDINKEADILLLGGDLTKNGTKIEANVLLREIEDIKIPIYGVLGNHDCQYGLENEIKKILSEKIYFLDGDGIDIDVGGTSIGLAGIKGFCGGFEPHPARAFGEKALKDFVYAGDRETEKLDEALSEINSTVKVVLMHYSPIIETAYGEPPEIYPFLGNKKLASPLDYYKVSLVFHGHCHHGSLSGKTKGGSPVYNVARVILKNNYALFELRGEKWTKKF
jgi:Icc-related predicted phosphoesterase